MSFSSARCAGFALLLCCVACSRNAGLPDPGSEKYRSLVSAFYVGLAGLQTGEDVRAKEKLSLATQIAPGEPAAWADLALLAVRQQNFDEAFQDADRGRSLAPDNSRIEMLLGLIESRRGKLPEAIAHLTKAAELDSKNLKALYALAQETERSGAAGAMQIFSRALRQAPRNVALLLEMCRLAARNGDAAGLRVAVAALAGESGAWPEEAQTQLAALAKTGAPVQAVFLRNVLARVPQYRRDLNEVQTPATFVSDPFTAFLKLPAPGSDPAAADLKLRFERAGTAQPALWAGALQLNDKEKPTRLWADKDGIQIENGDRIPIRLSPGTEVTGADLNYDFLTDLICAGPGGLHIFSQGQGGHFSELRLPASIASASYNGAWPFDVDLDGDLDIVLGTPGGSPSVLRNNGDSTFTVIHPFAGVTGLKAFAAADPEVVLIDAAGALHIFSNERLGQFRSRTLPPALGGRFLAVVAAGSDFMLLREDGSVFQNEKKIANAQLTTSTTLITGDFDNNGAMDLLAGGQIFLRDAKGFTLLPGRLDGEVIGAADLNGDGKLDLIGPGSVWMNRATNAYHWQDIQVRAATATGDQRINSFGIGGEVEIRSGLLTQKQAIASPLLHFGLGTQTGVEVARIAWPNGVVQGEFDLKANQQIFAQQRLKGSCPWLFAWDGTKMSFVKDGSPWSPALGLHINAQTVAGIGQTREWFKIPAENLKPHDGYYDLRITGELWETYYIDHYSLMVVDHPPDTEIYTDERFAVPAPPLAIYATSAPQPFANAHDDLGNDVSETVRALDRKYLDTFGRGPYQGLTRDHWVDLELPAGTPSQGPLYLIATGWLHPTDATVNVAIGQNSIEQPHGLSLEVPDHHGNWRVARKDLGFPAGKMKTIVLDIGGLGRRFRLRTNLEIYWDKLEWALPAVDRNRIQNVDLTTADLRYRGFSEVKAANASSPELPDYSKIATTLPIWHDLEGYATRYGDIRELLLKVDDRMVIVNAGDEVRLRFPEQPPAPPGWKRDYIMVGDGWIKDGDFNTVFSGTVLPLPYHGMKDYTLPPGRLEDDPGYRRHPGDWQTFHTRYVTADMFGKALRN